MTKLKTYARVLHRHIHVFEAALMLFVLAVVGYFSHAQLTPRTSNPRPDVAAAQTAPKFTTIVSTQMTHTKTPEAPEAAEAPKKIAPVSSELQPTNKSDILDSVEVEEQEYTALLTPNDPQNPLWFWDRINLGSAWDIETGDSGVVIAVIDSGYALNHQELADGWYINSGEQGITVAGDTCWDGSAKNKQSNGCDDDQNGYTDDWRGWDFYAVDNNPLAGQTNPNGGGVSHGTLVSGLIGAQANNSVGFAGVDWAGKIMPLQALSDDGSGYTSDIVAAIEYAVDNGADVINMSLGGAGNDRAMQAAVSYARSQNVVVVAASGNCATFSYRFCSELAAPGYMGYPALYDEVISVGATDSNNVRASFSSYGPELDIVAPGQGLSVSTTWRSSNQTSSYAGNISGTSFSSPIVAGVVGLIKAYDPEISNDNVLQLLRSTATKNGPGFSNEYGFGLLNAQAALRGLTVGGSASDNPRSKTVPSVKTSSGQNPASPASLGQPITSTVSGSPGDELSISAVQINTGQRIEFVAQKTNDDGAVSYDWNTSFLGAGPWRLTPNSQAISGISETIYIN